jgi:phosphoserine phosphatase
MGEPGWERAPNSPNPAGFAPVGLLDRGGSSVSGAVGLFLDVGGTLTTNCVQRGYAAALGVTARYDELEFAYQTGELDSHDFGARLVDLFHRAGFTRDVARERFAQAVLRDGVVDLLQAPAMIYLVSSGPSYFVRPLAERYGIPQDRVLCSEYTFSSNGGGLVSCEGVTEDAKRDFVWSRLRRHLVSVGCADDEGRDGPFLDVCDLGIVLGQSERYLAAPEIERVHQIVERLTCQLTRNPEWGQKRGHSPFLPQMRQ